MSSTHDPSNHSDRFNVARFLQAQESIYEAVRAELKSGRKRTHWMWFIFPQIAGLGFSSTTKHYAITGEAEARDYVNHPILGARLVECAELVLEHNGRSAAEIFGSPDDMKLRSSMTLFAAVAGANSVFVRVLDAYFHGQPDSKTLELLRHQSTAETN